MTDDDLRDRISTADPLRADPLPALSEGAREALLDRAVQAPSRRSAAPLRRRIGLGIGAVAVAAAVAAGVVVAIPTPAPRVLTLQAAPGGAGGACDTIGPQTVGYLRHADVAFAGTVLSTQGWYHGGTVTLRPTRFYRGGPFDEIVLNRPPMEGDFATTVGDHLLIAADDGAIMGCVLSGPASPELERYYDAAFG